MHARTAGFGKPRRLMGIASLNPSYEEQGARKAGVGWVEPEAIPINRVPTDAREPLLLPCTRVPRAPVNRAG